MAQNSIVVGTDVVVAVVLGFRDPDTEAILRQAMRGEGELIVLHHSLCSALYSIRAGDQPDIQYFREFIRYAKILDSPIPSGVREPEWRPTDAEVERWRQAAGCAE